MPRKKTTTGKTDKARSTRVEATAGNSEDGTCIRVVVEELNQSPAAQFGLQGDLLGLFAARLVKQGKKEGVTIKKG